MIQKKSLVLLVIIFATGLFCASLINQTAFAADKKGSPTIKLAGKKADPVTFSHARHQERLNDCKICHNNFKQEPGAIQAAISAGDLKSKQVMNKTCLKCHRKKTSTGKKQGPTSCKACHKK